MLEELLEFDKELFIFLNGMGTPHWDGFWLYLSRTFSAITIPLYSCVLFLSYRFFGLKKTVFVLILTAILIGGTELLSILFKNSIGRLRPCYQTEISEMMRLVRDYCGGQYGYFSAHASNSWAFATFFGMLFKGKTKFFLVFLGIWAFLVSYSRIYIGVHFPMDVITGMGFGILFGYFFSHIFSKLNTYF